MKKSILIAEDEEVTLALLRNVFGRSDLLVHDCLLYTSDAADE